jgi:hypothetical protein
MGTAAQDVRITFADGTPAHPVRPEIGGDLDLVRLEIETKRLPLKCATTAPQNGAPVTAIGNSLDAGVITSEPGTIKGVGESEIETDCQFVPGNSGGPILDASGHVLAVATYIRFGEKNPATAGTRYEKDRRFAVRLHDGMKWVPIPQWDLYAKAGALIESSRRLADEVVAAAQSLASNDLKRFKPRNAVVVSAVADFSRLQSRLAKMDGQTVTAMELQRNNNILATTYHMAFLKLRDACAPAIHELDTRKIPPQWGWLEKERKTSLENLQSLRDWLDSEGKKKPTFLSF